MTEDFKAIEEAEQLPDGLQFLTYDEVARILKVKRGTVRTWVSKGQLRVNVKLGRSARIPLSELRRFVAERTKVQEDRAFGRKRKPSSSVLGSLPPSTNT